MFKKAVATTVIKSYVAGVWAHAGVRVLTNPWRVKPLGIKEHAENINYGARWVRAMENSDRLENFLNTNLPLKEA